MQLIAGSKGEGGTLDCNHGGLREQELAQPVAKGVQGATGNGDAGAVMVRNEMDLQRLNLLSQSGV